MTHLNQSTPFGEHEHPSNDVSNIATSQSPPKTNQKRRMSLMEYMKLLPPSNPPISPDGIPEKNLPKLSPQEKWKLDVLGKTIYDIQREQSENTNESGSEILRMIINKDKDKSFEELSKEDQLKLLNDKLFNGENDELIDKDGSDNDERKLGFGKIKGEDGEEIYGIWKLKNEDENKNEDPDNDHDEGNKIGNEQNAISKALKQLNNSTSPDLSVHSYVTTSPSISQAIFWNGRQPNSEPPQYVSAPPSPKLPQGEGENADLDKGK